MASVRMTIMIDEEIKNLISQQAKENNRSASGEINQAIKQYLANNKNSITKNAQLISNMA